MGAKAGLVVAIIIAAVLVTFPVWAPLVAPTTTTHAAGYGAEEHGAHGEHAAETTTGRCVTGVLRAVDVNEKSIVVGGVKVYVRGRWSVNGETYNPYDMLGLLEKHQGEKITVCYYTSAEGEDIASKIVVGGIVALRS